MVNFLSLSLIFLFLLHFAQAVFFFFLSISLISFFQIYGNVLAYSSNFLFDQSFLLSFSLSLFKHVFDFPLFSLFLLSLILSFPCLWISLRRLPLRRRVLRSDHFVRQRTGRTNTRQGGAGGSRCHSPLRGGRGG